MLKITPIPGERFHVTYNGVPILLKSLKLGDEAVSNIDDILHSLGEPSCGNKIAFLTYREVDDKGTVIFFKHSATCNDPVYLADFPIELLSYLRQVELAILRNGADLVATQ